VEYLNPVHGGKEMDFVVVKITVNGLPIDPASMQDTHVRSLTLPVWSRLHLEQNPTTEFFNEWKRHIPTVGCSCAASFAKIEEELPPDFSSPEAFFARGVEWHNQVNCKLEAKQLTPEDALLLWRHRRPNTGRARCVVTIAIGKAFRSLLDFTRPYLRLYALRNDADYIELTNQTELWWGFEKFRTLHFAQQYEETLFVDADCLIRNDAPSLFGGNAGLLIHDDWQYHKERDWISSQREVVGRSLNRQFEQRNVALNSGVVYCKQSHADIWSQPPRTMNTNHTSEQFYVEQSAFRLGYQQLDSRMNWQIYFPGFWSRINDAYVVHFAGSKDKLANAKRVLEAWKSQGLA
jgi:hypothetical protein